MVALTKEDLMRIIIRVAAKDIARAWGLLVRHSPGTALPNRTFIVSEKAALALRHAGIRFKEIGRDEAEPTAREIETGERI
jgi:hypothetical protein